MSYVIYFIITIGILVFVHEFGHFIAAKLTKMRVDVFAIGFSKRLFGWNKITGFTFGDLPEDFDGQGNTDYRLNLLPLGGYVKIAGMIDESMDVKFLSTEPQPWEFRARPTLQKLFVISAGVLMNLLLAFLVFWGVNLFQPKPYIKTTTIGYVADNTVYKSAGLKAGDKILSINGKNVTYWNEVDNSLLLDNIARDLTIKIERDGKKQNIYVANNILPKDLDKHTLIFPAGYQIIIDSVFKDTPALKAGIKSGDIFYKLNNTRVFGSGQAVQIISSNKHKEIPITVIRQKDTLDLAVTPNEKGLIGISLGDRFKGIVHYKSLNVGQSFVQGVSDIGRFTALTYSMLSNVITGHIEFSSAFGGPVKIAQFAVKSADSGIVTFILFLAMLSLSLAILNILPFPVLDGGHLVIILIEGLIKREIPVKVKVAIQNTGFVILILFMAFIIYNDIISL